MEFVVQSVEHQIVALVVAGSLQSKASLWAERETCQTPYNVRMPEWSKGAVCKTVFRRFESDFSLKTEGSSSKEIRTGASIIIRNSG